MKSYYVYILTSKLNSVLYIGITNNLARRIYEHKNKLFKGFTEKYNVNKLVYCEEFNNIEDAIANEKKLKGWIRRKKVDLIDEHNPEWKDLSEQDPSLRSG